jgi:cytochrome oxidase Cu insertion factor (SCO1/SenC/PrrC family)
MRIGWVAQARYRIEPNMNSITQHRGSSDASSNENARHVRADMRSLSAAMRAAMVRSATAAGARLMLGLLCLGLCPSLCQPVAYAAAPVSADVLNEVPYDWQDEQGAATSLSQWRGKTVLLTMAYPKCRETCSYALHRMEELQQSADRAGTPIEVVVISYEPNISSGTWSIYRRHHHLSRTNWHFLTGSTANTQQFAKALQFPYWRYDEHLVHDFKILLIGPDGQIAETLTWATRNTDLFTEAAARCPSSDARDCKL